MYTVSIQREPSKREREKKSKEQNHLPHNYLAPNQSTKSIKNKGKPSTWVLTRANKENNKAHLSAWSEVSTSSKAFRFLSCQMTPKKNKGAASQAFFRFFPTCVPLQLSNVNLTIECITHCNPNNEKVNCHR